MSQDTARVLVEILILVIGEHFLLRKQSKLFLGDQQVACAHRTYRFRTIIDAKWHMSGTAPFYQNISFDAFARFLVHCNWQHHK